ncbi:MAG TPA: methyltransferase, partial [Magnetospirillum sp.]|nr:methyltransferase [Magnetospirillum sp.]
MPSDEPLSTSEDHFLGGRLVIRQPVNGYRAGSDPMFLAAAVPARLGDKVLDLGCGVGTASLCLMARLEGVSVVGLELQPELAELARTNAAANGFAERFRVIEGCLTEPPAEAPYHHFDHVITNPPWYEPGTIRPPQAESKAIGHMEEVELAEWLAQAVRFLKPKGRLFVVHRADRLGDILAALNPLRVGEVRVFPLWPKQGKAATRVVVVARRDAKTPLEVLPGLLLHHPDG